MKTTTRIVRCLCALVMLTGAVGVLRGDISLSAQREILVDARDKTYDAVNKADAAVKAAENSSDAAEKAKVPELTQALAKARAMLAVADVNLIAFDRGQNLTAKTALSTVTQQDVDIDARTQEAVDAYSKSFEETDATFMRKYGFGINLGYGYFGDLRHTAKVVQVRYNFAQRSSNDIQKALRKSGVKAAQDVAEGKWVGTKVTSLAGWIGYSVDNLESRDGTATEQPLMAGVAVGLGSGPERSSAISIDAGLGLFTKKAFKDVDWYVGISVDAVLFKTIVSAMNASLK